MTHSIIKGISVVMKRKIVFSVLLATCIIFIFGYIGNFNVVPTWFGFSFGRCSSHDPHYASEMGDISGPSIKVAQHSDDEEYHKNEDKSVANELYKKVRVLCWVMTNPNNHMKKAIHVKETWGDRCNIILFMSSKSDDRLPTIALPVSEGRNNLWAKTKEAFKYVYKHHRDDADWFLKADDDTYVIVENLRYMLSAHDPHDPIYFGCRFKPFVRQGYMSGGAGYVLSRTALDLLVEKGLPSPNLCRSDNDGSEDVEMGKCLEKVGVKAGDSRDALGRGRFFPFVPEHHLIPGHVNEDFWYWKYIYYKTDEGLDCCSDSAVSFHYVSPNNMYVLDYLIYHLKPFGINHKMEMPLIASDNNESENKHIATSSAHDHKNKDNIKTESPSEILTMPQKISR